MAEVHLRKKLGLKNPKRDAMIIHRVLNTDETYVTIGKEFGISAERVRSIVVRDLGCDFKRGSNEKETTLDTDATR